MIAQSRFEAKYLISVGQYHRIRNALLPFCRFDRYCRDRKGHRYPVRSLYFDQDNFQARLDKADGVNLRNKFRIRSYASSRDEVKFLKVEQKRRVGRIVYKYVDQISLDDYDTFRRTGSWDDTASETLMNFEALIRRHNMKAKLLVEYDREAMIARDGSGARFCFDHRVRYAQSDDLFHVKRAFRNDMAKAVVFEIKTNRDDSAWLSEFVREHDLKAVPNSKYANAVASSQTNIWRQ